MRVLVLNAGSSTVKWTLLDADTRAVIGGDLEEWAGEDLGARRGQLRALVRGAPAFDAAGHRVVHGGARFTGPALVDGEARAALDALVELDPLHMPPALAGIDAVTAERPSLPQVASFDTAFHAGLPPAAAGYALPFQWSERWGLRRYGFHGLSVAYAVSRVRELLAPAPRRLLVCHLGSGSSITAVEDGRSIDTTMGFSPLEGVVMATRAGSVDPGLLLHLQTRHGLGAEELRAALEHRSGLLGVSGVSGDLRHVLAAADAGQPRARLAYDELVWSVRRAIGAMAGVLGGADGIVFTGGIGEHSARVRAAVAPAVPGLVLDDQANASPPSNGLVSATSSFVSALVVEAREDLTILEDVLRLAPGPRWKPPPSARE